MSIEYIYSEPVKHRKKNIPEKHFSLVLQGGGAKGPALIGAYQALILA
jgi:predicted acylesterase/phospholipase RssA